MTEQHRCGDLIRLFDDLFAARYHVRLRGGADEPLYEPACGLQPAVICFRADYFASALHEVAHWCTAGARRRRLVDYGYWYAPDGRDAGAQAAFERAEVGPQALEWMFAEAAGFPFRPSLDNLEGGSVSKERFEAALIEERARRQQHGLPPRAAAFRRELAVFYSGQELRVAGGR
ncbi:MAG: elongation factor P hydroxylase [Gammaproteobacteria bacterium]|nr:elongation factor P hydroxylase [Gammaproteobacteria bacterium]